ncbi:hypothetical protein FNE58_30630 [Bacillus thuringiensis]|nr:hypothetical protein BT4G5_07230 [Bacillus thuringiensis serovar galleriae]KAB1381500.1 hypothetical protein FPG93_02450 [Bacillus thuringiensis]KMQ10646.1 hypothetical protein TU66_17090 [Bacillus cereus]OIX20896.1 hypothetical protein BMT18_07935 [Bacillus thuringiensis serovar aizawai]MDR5043719.1 hypothetical protein [Bacillus thuringiensis]
MEFYDLGIAIKELRIKKIYHNPNYVMEYVHKVKLAINLNTLYLLGELYYLKGWNLLRFKQQNEEDIANNMKKALFIFELTEKENLIKMVKEKYFENQNEKSHS